MDAATVKGVIDRLKARGLVKLTKHEVDKRRLLVSLTPEGREAVAAADPGGRDDHRRNRRAALRQGGRDADEAAGKARLSVARTVKPMPHSRSILWRNLHTPGHDVALIAPAPTGWQLSGMAAFLAAEGPVAVDYAVEIDEAWCARRGNVAGIAGGRRFSHSIERTPDGWMLDGRHQGLPHIVDLDFGFTPATNFQQLSRIGLAVGERAAFSVAWFDIGRETLVELPQIYERLDERLYAYQSPSNDYEAMLAMDESGFVRTYPELWQMEEQPA